MLSTFLLRCLSHSIWDILYVTGRCNHTCISVRHLYFCLCQVSVARQLLLPRATAGGVYQWLWPGGPRGAMEPGGWLSPSYHTYCASHVPQVRSLQFYWGIPSSDGIPIGVADFFFFFLLFPPSKMAFPEAKRNEGNLALTWYFRTSLLQVVFRTRVNFLRVRSFSTE